MYLFFALPSLYKEPCDYLITKFCRVQHESDKSSKKNPATFFTKVTGFSRNPIVVRLKAREAAATALILPVIAATAIIRSIVSASAGITGRTIVVCATATGIISG